MIDRRVLLSAFCAGALCSCSFGYELLMGSPVGTGGASGSLGGAAGASPGEAGAGGGGGAPSSAGGENLGGMSASGGTQATGGTSTGGASTGGQDGMGGEGEPPLDPPRISFSAGATHTCALSTDGDVYCWGDNTNEALGGFVGASTGTPVPVMGVGVDGDFVTLSVGSQNA